MSRAVNTRPAWRSGTVIDRIRACASGLRTNATSHSRGKERSPTNRALPARCRASSLRGTRTPIPVDMCALPSFARRCCREYVPTAGDRVSVLRCSAGRGSHGREIRHGSGDSTNLAAASSSAFPRCRSEGEPDRAESSDSASTVVRPGGSHSIPLDMDPCHPYFLVAGVTTKEHARSRNHTPAKRLQLGGGVPARRRCMKITRTTARIAGR